MLLTNVGTNTFSKPQDGKLQGICNVLEYDNRRKLTIEEAV